MELISTQPESISVAEAVNSSIQYIHEDSRYKDYSVTVESTVDSKILVNGHFFQLTQVFTNLLTNAYEAIGKDKTGQVFITSEITSDKALIRITDNGSGFDKAHISKLFDKLFTTKTSQGGTGLGLAICRDIIRQHQGDIYLNESHPQTQFVVELPLV